jgi:hypothetical protein
LNKSAGCWLVVLFFYIKKAHADLFDELNEPTFPLSLRPLAEPAAVPF